MTGLALRSPLCVSHTVIHGRVLGSQAAHLQIQRVLRIISGDGEPALHRSSMLCREAIGRVFYPTDPLRPLPGSLADPVHPVGTEGESRGCTGESQRPPGPHHVSPRLHQLRLTLHICEHRDTAFTYDHTGAKAGTAPGRHFRGSQS